MKILLLLSFCLSMQAMEEGIHIGEGYYAYPEEKDLQDEELSKIVVSFYFPGRRSVADVSKKSNQTFIHYLYPRIKQKIRESRDSIHPERVLALKELETLLHASSTGGEEYYSSQESMKSPASFAAYPSDAHTNYSSLHGYIVHVVSECMEEMYEEKNDQMEELLEIARRKERQKRVAMIMGAMGTLVTAAVSLIVRFTGV